MTEAEIERLTELYEKMFLKVLPFSIGFGVLLLALCIVCAVWIKMDSDKIGIDGLMWCILVVLFGWIPVLAYFMVARKKARPFTLARACGRCGQPNTSQTNNCLSCGNGLMLPASIPSAKKFGIFVTIGFVLLNIAQCTCWLVYYLVPIYQL